MSGRRLEFGSESGYRRHAVGCGDTESMATQVGPTLLVAQTSFLGDVVLTTPLLTALRARPP